MQSFSSIKHGFQSVLFSFDSGPYDFGVSNKRPVNGPEFDPNERRRPQIMIKPSNNVGESFPSPPVGRRERPNKYQPKKPMPTLEEEFDAYFDNEEELVAERPVEKNVYDEKNNVESTISLSPDGKRLRRKTRKTTTTEAPTTMAYQPTTTPVPTTTTPPSTSTPADFFAQKKPSTSTQQSSNFAPDFFAQNKPVQAGGFNQKDEFDNYWAGDIGVSLAFLSLNQFVTLFYLIFYYFSFALICD